MVLVPKALEFAAVFQKDLVLKGTRVPFMSHSLNVCKLLAERACKDELQAAALLHDIVEVTPVTIEEIKKIFGIPLFRLVRAATEPFKLQKVNDSYDVRNTWVFRKGYTFSLVEKKETPLDVLLLILAEKTDNIIGLERDLKQYGDTVWKRYNAGRELQEWFYHCLLVAGKSRKDIQDKAYIDLLRLYECYVHKVFNN